MLLKLLSCKTQCQYVLINLLSIIALPCHAGWQDTPDNLRLQAVGEDLRLNGTPMKIKAFTADLPMESVLKQVHDNWEKQADRSPVTRTKNINWIVLNQSIGNQHRSFQIREISASKVEGYVALTSPQQTTEPKLVVRLPSDVQTVSIIDSGDGGKISQQIIAVSPRSIDATVSALETSLKAAGWERHVLKKNGTLTTFSANRNGQEFDARLSAQKAGTLLMMNTIVQSK
ncbi:hypothetical protein [Undibacterium sp. CY21W]|uniref:hypothetical protein n=1 Tax=Undibacterium sp. CY21W TaxID=2762293 RepID=UPI00164C2B6A|nr:hypothetical protein [Undibacterium sp. CY21W]MBC3927411.1 hypothetical protein [Undibacterium sp. CY21W]